MHHPFHKQIICGFMLRRHRMREDCGIKKQHEWKMKHRYALYFHIYVYPQTAATSARDSLRTTPTNYDRPGTSGDYQ
jgi:hypothetical protein